MPLVPVPPVRYRCAMGRARPLPPMAEQHGRVATYSCLAIEGATTPPGSPVYRDRYAAPRFPRKATGVV